MAGTGFPALDRLYGRGNSAPSGPSAPVPTQTFSAANILGTAIPQVGDAKGRPNYAAATGGGVDSRHVIIVVVLLIGAGYLLYHLNFEK